MMTVTTTTAGAHKQSWGECHIATVALVLTRYILFYFIHYVTYFSFKNPSEVGTVTLPAPTPC